MTFCTACSLCLGMTHNHEPVAQSTVVGIEGCKWKQGGHIIITHHESVEAMRIAGIVHEAIDKTIFESDHCSTSSWCADVILQSQMADGEAKQYVERVSNESFRAIQRHVLESLRHVKRSRCGMDAYHADSLRLAVLNVQPHHQYMNDHIKNCVVHKLREYTSLN